MHQSPSTRTVFCIFWIRLHVLSVRQGSWSWSVTAYACRPSLARRARASQVQTRVDMVHKHSCLHHAQSSSVGPTCWLLTHLRCDQSMASEFCQSFSKDSFTSICASRYPCWCYCYRLFRLQIEQLHRWSNHWTSCSARTCSMELHSVWSVSWHCTWRSYSHCPVH